MSGLLIVRRVINNFKRCVLAMVLVLPITTAALAADKVSTHKDQSGWKLQVNGSDYYVKGVVWGYTPRNENYTYNLWGESDDFIRKVLDYDFGLMKAANVNSVRSFSMIPPHWITYIYKEHGIMTVVNPLMGRYGYNINGKWIPNTDYSDELTRATLKADMLKIVDQYKNTPGVLMFAFGNESNYGLSWSSFEIEDLPVGEQWAAKARYLYSLYNEVIKAGKKIAPNHPFSIVNGDIQYIDLIKELCPDLDVLGVNAYRGPSFTSMWKEVEAKLDLPIVLYEFGSDAFDARNFEEAQLPQAIALKHQWQEMYNKSYGNGEESNSIGGFVFEWRDEWWKYLQTENLDVQDNNASWSNQAYLFDWAEGKNNMNEEWFGITALGTPNSEGVYTARPRMAYDVLSEIWKMDPFQLKKSAINQNFEALNMDLYALKGEVRQLKSETKEEKQTLRFTGGSLRGEFVVKGTEQEITERGENGLEFSDGQMVFLDFAFQPSDKIEGRFSLNVLGNVADKEPLEIQYGRRGLPISVVTEGPNNAGNVVVTTTDFVDRERVEIYDFNAKYLGERVDVEAFYHTERFHWKYEGDFFGLVSEATDLNGMDIWNSKAPEGIEVTGKGSLEGITMLLGPEVYWGANPKVILRYSTTLGKSGKTNLTVMHSEDIARRTDSSSATQATDRQTRQTTLYLKREFSNKLKLELGAIASSSEKIGDTFTRVVRNRTDDTVTQVVRDNIFLDEIDFKDTLGFKTKWSFPLWGGNAYFATHHAGLVADGGDGLREFGTRHPGIMPYSSLGNKAEYEAGIMYTTGDWLLYPRVLYRDNLVHANPFRPSSINGGVVNPGSSPRNREDDPFAVLGNREARAAEFVVTYDPTGATPFYDWDNEWREDAKFAFNFAANYTEYPTFTDANQFFFTDGGFNASFGVGLPAEDVWEVSSRMVFNPSSNVRVITNLKTGFNQSSGDPNGGTRKFYVADGKVVIGKKHIISGYVKKDAWGPYDFHRQFNVTFPEQFKLDYSILLDQRRDELHSTKVGVRTLYRTADENSPDDEYLEGVNDYIFQTVFYFTYMF